MMGSKEETKTVRYCDLCGSTTKNTSLFDTCHVCGREFGWCCQVRLYNVYNTKICKECFEEPAIQEIMKRYLEQWRATGIRLKTDLQTIKVAE